MDTGCNLTTQNQSQLSVPWIYGSGLGHHGTSHMLTSDKKMYRLGPPVLSWIWRWGEYYLNCLEHNHTKANPVECQDLMITSTCSTLDDIENIVYLAWHLNQEHVLSY